MKKIEQKKDPLVSIVTPSYNSEKYIKYTIESVLNQTYKNWEMIIVDDISTDKTVDIIKEYQQKDDRIKLIILDTKGGASIARNRAIKEAVGKYIAFLDSDDLWKKDKLKKQVDFMEKNDCYFSYTDYEYMNNKGDLINKKRVCPNKISYFGMLLGNNIGCLTVMYHAEKVGKISIPKLNKRNDYAMWCLALKKVKTGRKLNEILSIYRLNGNSLSSGKKTNLLKYHYLVHNKINNFNPLISSFFVITNIANYFINKKIRDKKI